MSDAPSPPAFTDMVAALEATGPLAETRPEATTDALCSRYPELGAVTVEPFTIAGPHGPVDARRYAGATRHGDVLVWLHGGGWIGGNLDMPEAHRVALSLAAEGIEVVSAEYRKALHGVHHPVPSDDVAAIWSWVRTHVDGRRFFLGGASAGANLSAGVTLRLRDEGAAVPDGIVLAYPLLHSELPPIGAALQACLDAAPAGTFFFTPELTREITRHYAGSDDAMRDPHAWPALGDLAGTPATYIVNAEFDTLRASSEAFADALVAAGVDVTVELEPATGHGFLDDPVAPAATAALARMAKWITR